MNKNKNAFSKLFNEYNKLSGFIIFFAIWSFVIGIALVLGNDILASIIFLILAFAVGYFTIKEILLIDKEIEEMRKDLKYNQRIK